MNFEIKKVNIFVTVPIKDVEKIRTAVCEAGAGIIGNYDYCTYSVKGVGTFRPNEKADPYIGKKNKLEFVKEEKLEFVCAVEKVKQVVAALRKAHPYEEPAINIYPLLEESDF